MLKLIFNISLLALFSLSLYGQDVSCDPFLSELKFDSYKDTQIVTVAKRDVTTLQSIYKCIKNKAKKVVSSTGTLNYSDAMGEAVVLENDCINFAADLKKKADDITTNSTTFASGAKTTPSERAASLTAMITSAELTTLQTNLKQIATGVYTASKDVVDLNLNTLVDTWKKDTTDTDRTLGTGSLLTNLNKVKTDNANATVDDINTKLKTTLTGDFSDATKFAKFKTDLKGKVYDLSNEAELPFVAQNNNNKVSTNNNNAGNTNDNNNSNNNNNSAANNNNIAATLAALQQLTADQNNALQKLEDNEAYNLRTAPAYGNNASKSGSSGSGDSGVGSFGGGFGGRGFMDDDTRKDLIAKAKEREKAQMRQEMLKTLYGGNTSSKKLGANPLGNSSGSSLRDLFTRKFEENTNAPKKDIPSIFGGGSDNTKEGDEKYRSYYKNGSPPPTFSSRDLALNRFSSMYESARMKALTEDAYQEFAGRYIDLFLLVHTIVDHEYRDKGKLMNLTEVVPSPLGPPKKY